MNNTISSNNVSIHHPGPRPLTPHTGHNLDNPSLEHLGGDLVLLSTSGSVTNVPSYSFVEPSSRYNMSQQNFCKSFLVCKKSIKSILWNLCKSIIGRSKHCERSPSSESVCQASSTNSGKKS